MKEDEVGEHSVYRVTRRVTPWFEEAFRSRALGERIGWETVFGTVPAPDGSGRITPAVLVYAELPAAQLGHQPHHVIAQIGILGLTRENVDEGVAMILGRLHELRRNELSVANGHEKAPGA